MTKSDTPAIPVIDLGSFSASKTAAMEVRRFGRQTGWYWEFAGPGHPTTIALNAAALRDNLDKQARIEQAQVNGKKWKADAKAPDEVRAENVKYVVDRLIGWSPAENADGGTIEFSTHLATTILLAPDNVDLLMQCMEFLGSVESFMPRSA